MFITQCCVHGLIGKKNMPCHHSTNLFVFSLMDHFNGQMLMYREMSVVGNWASWKFFHLYTYTLGVRSLPFNKGNETGGPKVRSEFRFDASNCTRLLHLLLLWVLFTFNKTQTSSFFSFLFFSFPKNIKINLGENENDR